MTPTALVTIQLDGWPPPTIEIRALVAALPQPEPGDSDAAPNAIQHLTELVLAFPTSEPDTDAGDAQIRLVAERALSSIHRGGFQIRQARITP